MDLHNGFEIYRDEGNDGVTARTFSDAEELCQRLMSLYPEKLFTQTFVGQVQGNGTLDDPLQSKEGRWYITVKDRGVLPDYKEVLDTFKQLATKNHTFNHHASEYYKALGNKEKADYHRHASLVWYAVYIYIGHPGSIIEEERNFVDYVPGQEIKPNRFGV